MSPGDNQARWKHVQESSRNTSLKQGAAFDEWLTTLKDKRTQAVVTNRLLVAQGNLGFVEALVVVSGIEEDRFRPRVKSVFR